MLIAADVYRSSERPLARPWPPEYPGHFELQKTSRDATLRWNSREVFVDSTLKGHSVGLEEMGDGVWSVYFRPLRLGWLDEADDRVMDGGNRVQRQRW
jgi:putative transposase